MPQLQVVTFMFQFCMLLAQKQSSELSPALFCKHAAMLTGCLARNSFLILTADAQAHKVKPSVQRVQLQSHKMKRLRVSPAPKEDRMLICLRSPEVLWQVGFIKTICFAISHLLYALQFKRILVCFIDTSTLTHANTPGYQARVYLC